MENSISTHKTRIEHEDVQKFLDTHYNSSIANLSTISGGEGSQAFSFELNGEKLILRVNKHSDRGFKKDLYAYLHFTSPYLPIPEIKEIGKMDSGNHFAISEMVDGTLFKNLSDDEFEKTLPSLFESLKSVHAIDVSTREGYGKWNEDGQASYKSWKDVLLGVDEFASELFGNSILEKDVWDKVYARFVSLLPFCPEEKFLVHSDYNFDNVLAKNEKVSGVIDWETSMYGDFLYDIAWIQFFAKDFDYEQAYLKHHQLTKDDIQNFDERILCYKLYIGLSTLSFYAYSKQEDKYAVSKEKLRSLLSESL